MQNENSEEKLLKIVTQLFNGNFKRSEHISYNYHYFGYSEKYNMRIFVKIFTKKNIRKFETEVAIVQNNLNLYVDHFEEKEFCFLVLKEQDYEDFNDIELRNKKNIVRLAKCIAKFHLNQNVENIPVKYKIAERIDNTLEELKERENYNEIKNVWEQMLEFRDIADFESELYPKVIIHGDFGIRNIKKNKGESTLIDFERSKKDLYYLDFVKFFYIDLKQNNKLKELFLEEYFHISGEKRISKILESFLVFYTGLGIMKYTMDFEDRDFEQIGLKMIEDTKKFWKKKNILKSILLFS